MEDYAYALRRLQGDLERGDAWGSSGSNHGAKGRGRGGVQHAEGSGKGMGTDQLSFVLRVVEAIADAQPHGAGPPMGGNVLLPNGVGQLAAARTLVFNDASWLAGEGECRGGRSGGDGGGGFSGAGCRGRGGWRRGGEVHKRAS